MPKRLDVLFINPGNSRAIYQELSIKFSAIEPPIFCGLFAGFMRNKGYSVEIIDVPAHGISPEEIGEIVSRKNPVLTVVAVYGFQPSSSTQNMQSARNICQAIKASDPNLKILITGTHPAALPERTLAEEAVDFVCTREGPNTILGLVEALKTSIPNFENVPDLGYRSNFFPCFTTHGPLITNLDEEMPGMAWDLLPMDRYRAHNWHCFDDVDHRTPYASLHTSLGCPYHCNFCCINAPFGTASYRMWSPAWVLREIDILVQKYGIRNVKIADEMFFLNDAHVFAICDGIIERDYDLNIWAYTRIDTMKDSYLEKSMKAGIRWPAIGIESGSKHVRDGADKKFKNLLGRDDVNLNIIAAVRKIQDAGLYAGCNYIFGLPDDTAETMQDTLNLAKEINSEYANFYCAMAYPGSPLYTEAKRKGLPLPDDPSGPGWIGYSQHSYETLPLPTDTLAASEVLRFRDNAFLEYFTSPDYLALINQRFGPKAVKHIEEMTSFQGLKRKILGN